MNARSAALGDPGRDPAKIAHVGTETAVIITETLQKLRELPPPAGEEAVVDAIWAKADALAADYRALAAAIRSGDQAEVNHLASKSNADMKVANAAANDYGLTVCGS
jgi:hypothetical protein